ncbi:SGNH/GDSL hydrolase family protein [Mycobacterium sp. MYCO198283]|uniref:SGNH/GDSL hydrolase family protein n=1 Tax=Mycobacterium sp. MYCO198283 TaxID=2883505 RepID=UPI001E596138|nr:SGNH/GDSL hydrolase family protein [Mycobacterium sp. MYCO198283]MCG5432196.1 SGNH/GDSL hydrolase family protein [Mycobacterium sp. MYCO198283]
MARYVALGSSMAAGPGIAPRAPGSPRRAGRSARNYPHLLAEALGHDLVDVTYSGATTAHVLSERRPGAAPQVDALDGTEALVTVTIGGNDVGYVPLLMAAGLPRALRRVPLLGDRLRELLNPAARDAALAGLGAALQEVGRTVRARAPRARVLFVEYLTLLPPPGTAAPPLAERDAALGRHVAAELAHHTRAAAATTGCEVVPVAAASADHHAWSAAPWTTKPGLPVPGRPAPLHPNAAGMRAVAELVARQVARTVP